MKMISLLLASSSFLFHPLLSAHAQDDPPSVPSQILQIYREGIRPGRDEGYVRIGAEVARVCTETPCPQPYLAIKSLTGPNQVWFIHGYDSYLSMERMWQLYATKPKLMSYLSHAAERKAELIADQQSVIAWYRGDLSDGVGLTITHTRYFSITTVHVYPGHNEEFEEIARAVRRPRGRSDNHSIYQVISGEINGTFLIVTPLRSLQDFDDAQYLRGENTALSDSDRSRLRQLTTSTIQMSETRLFALDPLESYAAREWTNADPEFWAPARTERK